MVQYKRVYVPGGTYIFTLVTHQRRPIFSIEQNIKVLRQAFRKEQARRNFHMAAIVILPDHLHCIFQLPRGDSNFSSRWREIKKSVTRNLAESDDDKRLVWQNRFWEHLIRDENDWRQHLDYIHYNPVKHGLVRGPADRRWSSFHKLVENGWYEEDWGSSLPESIADMELE